MNKSTLESYRTFIEQTDEAVKKLIFLHKDHLKCGKGCSSCCTDLSLLPIEWWAAREAALDKEITPGKPAADTCIFLLDDICALYDNRPLICRIHGLPLAYPIEEYDSQGRRVFRDQPEWHLIWCDLNFTNIATGDPQQAFEKDEVLCVGTLDQELLKINEAFLKTPEGSRFTGSEYLPIDDLFKELRE